MLIHKDLKTIRQHQQAMKSLRQRAVAVKRFATTEKQRSTAGMSFGPYEVRERATP